MKKFTDYFTDDLQTELFEVQYKYLGDKEIDFDVRSTDNISVLTLDDERLRLLVTRKIEFNPQTFFEISASYFVDHFLKKNIKSKIKWEDYNVQEEIEKNIGFFAGHEMSRVSLVISQITSAFGNNPLITAPVFSIDKR